MSSWAAAPASQHHGRSSPGPSAPSSTVSWYSRDWAIPWALWGHSGGAFWVSSMTARHPERIDQPTNLLESLLVARDEEGALFTEDEIYANAVTMPPA